jgi:hypothetical protein
MIIEQLFFLDVLLAVGVGGLSVIIENFSKLKGGNN